MNCSNRITLEGQKYSFRCRQCPACLLSRGIEWKIRNEIELRYSKSAYFVTLTYSDDWLPDEGLRYRDFQLFMKRLRKADKNHIRFFMCGEYGEKTHRAHYHAILYNLHDPELVNKHWKKGLTHTVPANPNTIAYVVDYLNKKQVFPVKKTPPFNKMSLKPAIGYQYIEHTRQWHQDNLIFYFPSGKFKLPLPEYYRKRIFTEDQLELWREQLSTEILMKVREELDKFDGDSIKLEEFRQKVINSKLILKSKKRHL